MMIAEQYASRENTTGKNRSVTLMYMIGQSEDDVEVLDFIKANIPQHYLTLPLLRTQNTPIGNGWWRTKADYGIESQTGGNPADGNANNPGANDALTPDIKIDSQSVSQHITQSLSTRSKIQATADARAIPDFKGAIAVSKTGVTGCDIQVPSLSWSETWTFLPWYITWGVIKTWRSLEGRVNSKVFRNFPIEEVMFDGFSTEAKGVDLRKVHFRFKAQENVTVGVDQFLTGWPAFTKAGWDFLWVDYEQGTLAGAIVQVPRALYIENVGRPNAIGNNKANFDPLGIGA